MWRNDQFGRIPGQSAAFETYENHFRWGRDGLGIILGGNISGAARDAGNTPTTVLRPGLLLGQITSSGLLTNWSPTATDGSQLVHSILMTGLRVQDLDGNNQGAFTWVLAGGPVQAAKVLNLDNVARAQMRDRFLFDDRMANPYATFPHLLQVTKATSYTVVASDAGTLFDTLGAAGAVTFTLPALAAGAGPFTFLNLADQNMIVASDEGDNVVALNDLSADSLAFSTSSEKIGGMVRVYANAAGTKWIAEILSGANTVTIAT